MAVFKVMHRKNTPTSPKFPGKKYHDENSLYDVIPYCCNPQKTKSGYIGCFGASVPYAAEQMDKLAIAYGKACSIRLRHMMLSFGPGERITPFLAYQIAYQAAWYYGREYQILFAVHENKQLLHVHFVMNTVSYLDGHKYAGKREDYYEFQDYLIQILKPFGIDISFLA